MELHSDLECRLVRWTQALVNQSAARIVIPAEHAAPGCWFGGGNLVADDGGGLWLVGRFRNTGDSRLGISAGDRGRELVLFHSADQGATFQKKAAWNKQRLSLPGQRVLSIEGSALWVGPGEAVLYVSTEKAELPYPPGFEDYRKPETGVWTIDCLRADSIAALDTAPVEPFLSSSDPGAWHVKDPFLFADSPDSVQVMFCSHPFSWTSSNTGYVDAGREHRPVFEFFSRGTTWDVAMTRGTCVVNVPQVGPFSGHELSLMFYDGGECVRNLAEHSQAVSRPRGYSCEELGGVAYFPTRNLSQLTRLSKWAPLFVSPHGTGCSRYVDVLETPAGYFATWQQGQADGSQPLVMNFVSRADTEKLLAEPRS